VSASIASLKRVAAALHTSMAEVFEENDGDSPRLVRAAEMHGVHVEGLGTKYLLTPMPLDNLEAFIGSFAPGGTTGEEAYSHGHSDELFMVLNGEFEVELGGERFILTDGDCVTYNSSVPHRATNLSATEEGRALGVISPPSY
jgi:mannose-6-phosphate isomerase-like protein (cupin superfamily)